MDRKDTQFAESVSGLTQRLKEAALRSGFLLVGSCRAVAAPSGFSDTSAESSEKVQTVGAAENGGNRLNSERDSECGLNECDDQDEQNTGNNPKLKILTAVRDHVRTLQRFEEWLTSGAGASMRYLSDRWKAYHDPASVLPGVRSFLVLAAGYRTVQPAPLTPGTARIATYAWGDDYHLVLRHRLRSLIQVHREIAPQYVVRGCVDTEPLFEKELARRAGLGWIGKHTLLTHPTHGTRLLLAVLLTSAVLEYDEPMVDGETTLARDPCRDCDACVNACPTGALRPYRLDARRCRSYLTIESRDPIPEELSVGENLFGCERCQDVCPWNQALDLSRPTTIETVPRGQWVFGPRAGTNPITLAEIKTMDEATFRERFKGSAIERAGAAGLKRTTEKMENEKSPQYSPVNPC